MLLPSRKKCFALMTKYGMYDNIKKHVQEVEKVGVFLAKELNKANLSINEKLVSRASLLHDIAKVCEIEGKGSHGDIGQKILTKEGYKDLGTFCQSHYLGKEKKLKTWEEKIISYADKRVLHNKIVDMEIRIEKTKKRYSLDLNHDEIMADSNNLEKEIFSSLKIKPKDIKSLINRRRILHEMSPKT